MVIRPKLQSLLSENTMVPVSLVIIIIGGSVWLGTQYSLAKNNADQIVKIHSDIEGIEESRNQRRTQLWNRINDQGKRLSRIEGKLDILIELQKRETQK